jgi:uncharacterized membrane protein YcaP (DUF421 family)
LSKLNSTSDELKKVMREHGIEHFKEVNLAILEINGNIRIICGTDSLRPTHYKRRKNLKNLVRISLRMILHLAIK